MGFGSFPPRTCSPMEGGHAHTISTPPPSRDGATRLFPQPPSVSAHGSQRTSFSAHLFSALLSAHGSLRSVLTTPRRTRAHPIARTPSSAPRRARARRVRARPTPPCSQSQRTSAHAHGATPRAHREAHLRAQRTRRGHPAARTPSRESTARESTAHPTVHAEPAHAEPARTEPARRAAAPARSTAPTPAPLLRALWDAGSWPTATSPRRPAAVHHDDLARDVAGDG